MTDLYTMFHGTSDIHLESIKDKGLVPNPSKKSWADHSESNIDVPGRKSLYGVYFSSQYKTASDAGWRSVEKFGGNEIIIVAKIDPNYAIADEDQIWCHVESTLYNLLVRFKCSWHYPSQFLGILDRMDIYTKSLVEKNFCDDLNKELCLGNSHSIDYELLTSMMYVALDRILAHSFVESPLFYSTKYYSGKGLIKKAPKPKSIDDAETEYLIYIDQLTRIYTYSVFKRFNKNHTLRILEPVGMYSYNRIIGIYRVHFHKAEVETVYGNDRPFILEELSRISECSQSL